jgi:hypothetical protein
VIFTGSHAATTLLYKAAMVQNAAATWSQAAVNGLVGRVGYSTDVAPVPHWSTLLLEVDASPITTQAVGKNLDVRWDVAATVTTQTDFLWNVEANTAVGPDLVYLTGFESGVMSAEGGGIFSGIIGTVAADTSVVRTGTYSMRCDAAAGPSYGFWNTPADMTVGVLRCYFRLPANPTGARAPVAGFDTNEGTSVTAQVTTGGVLNLYADNTLIATGISVATGAWHRLDLRVDVSAATWAADWQINGAAQTQGTSAQAAAALTQLTLGVSGSGTPTATLYLDDVACSQVSVDYPLGAGQVEVLRPNGVGTHVNSSLFENNSATAVGATFYQLIDESPPNTSDWVTQLTANNTAYLEFGFENTARTAIRGVRAVAAVFGAGTSASVASTRIVDGSTESVVFTGSHAATTLSHRGGMVTPAAGIWTQDAVNTLVGRVGHATAVTSAPRWSSVILEISVDPANTLTAVSKNLDVRWSVGQTVSKNLQLQWDVQGSPGAVSIDLRWNITEAGAAYRKNVAYRSHKLYRGSSAALTPASKSLNVRWTVLSTSASKSLDLRWSVLADVTAIPRLDWPITLYQPTVTVPPRQTFPVVRVAVAFTYLDSAGQISSNPADTPVWTDLSSRVREGSVTRGRQRELDQTQAGRATFVLDNRDRALDPDNSASTFSPNVIPMRRIKAEAFYNKVTYPLFDGYVDGWPQQWEAAGTERGDAFTTVDATDGFKILAGEELPSSPYAAEVLFDSPRMWFRLGDQIAFSSTTGQQVVSDSVAGFVGTVVGSPTVGAEGLAASDADTSMQFTTLDIPTSTGARIDDSSAAIVGSGPFTIDMLVKPTALLWLNPTTGQPVDTTPWALFEQFDPGGSNGTSVTILRTAGNVGRIQFVVDTGAAGRLSVNSNMLLTLGEKYHVACTWGGTGQPLRIYVNGVDVTGFFATTTGSLSANAVRLGHSIFVPGVTGVQGFLDEVAVYPTLLSAARIAAHHSAGLNAWGNELSGERINRILDLIGWSDADRAVDAGSLNVQGSALGTSALEYMRLIEETENGLIFMTANGKFRFRSRNAILLPPYTTPQTGFGDGEGELPYSDLELSFDDELLKNSVRVQREGGVQMIAEDAASISKYRKRSHDRTGLLYMNDNESLSSAQWIIAHYGEPRLRVNKIVLQPQRDDRLVFPAVLAREIGDRISITRRPLGGGAPIDKDVHVEGMTHKFSNRKWETTWSLSPAEGQSFWRLGDPVQSVLGITTRLSA